MNNGVLLRDLFQIKTRFARAVNIEADYGRAGAVSGYVVTPLVRELLSRIGHGLSAGSRSRAWSLTGPYGAGKSAAALFLASVLGYPVDPEARGLLESVDHLLLEGLYRQVNGLDAGGFSVVPVVSSREPFTLALYRGLLGALCASPFAAPDVDVAKGWVQDRCNQIIEGRIPFVHTVSDEVRQVGSVLRRANGGSLGVLIILDELGKLLEYAGMSPEQSDVYYLQALADLANHSGDDPVAVIAILHQAFERYAVRLSPTQQQEWSKVQGRFEDIGFLQSPAELLRLVGSAIQRQPGLDGLERVIAEEASLARGLGLAPRELREEDADEALNRCAPLHPTVAVVLDRLFKSRLAQNERSLFAFLTSGEPHGFQDYLQTEEWTHDGYRPFYRIDRLYDYVHASLGSALYAHIQGKRWAEIEDALERLPREASQLDARVVKAIGLLGVVGDQTLVKASEAVLECGLADGRQVTGKHVRAAIGRLCDWGIALFRKHKQAYGLWEGSDVDLDDRFQKALGQIERKATLASLLTQTAAVRPYLARRHLHQTGTLRYFTTWIVGAEELEATMTRPLEGADGAIVFVLPETAAGAEGAVAAALEVSSRLGSPRQETLFFAIPRQLSGLRESLDELAAWAWVTDNTPELEGDSVARRELAGRRSEALQRFDRLCMHSLDKASSHASCRWVYGGRECSFASAALLSSAFSDACDLAYHKAPKVHNELVNRATLSSAAAAARRNLIERMLTNSTEPRLGISRGFPPELSMYLSVLGDSGLHHASGNTWVFGPSGADDTRRVKPLWQGIDEFLSTTESEKRPVSELFDLLRQPPYGVKDGLLPIYLAAALLSWEMELAFYENGSFVPKPNVAAFERLMKAPELFSIQRHRLGGARSYLFERYSTLLGETASPSGQTTLMMAVRPILTFVRQLPAYSQGTRRVSPPAAAVREAILSAREPAPLLFTALPTALGMPALGPDADIAEGTAFFAAVRDALLELQHAYDALLSDVRGQLTEALRLPGGVEAGRLEAARRANALRERVVDLRLRAFVLRLGDTTLRDREWLESVAAMIASKAPKSWNDRDVVEFGLKLADISALFRRVEDIVASQTTIQDVGGTCGLRLAVTAASGEEHREVVSLLPAEEGEVEAAATEMLRTLRAKRVPQRVRVAAVAELARRVLQGRSAAGSGDTDDAQG